MDLCQICRQDEDWHREHKPKHKFIAEGETPRLMEEPAEVTPTPGLRGDPVLRLALLKAGVLTDMNLLEAEVWIREAANAGGAVVIEDGEFKVLSLEAWIAKMASGK